MFWSYLMMTLLIVIGLLLMIIILLQRGRGGGLAGAFGGAGGASAFGTRAGDVFTKITAVMAIIWVVLAAASRFVLEANQSPAAALFAEDEGDEIGPSLDDSDGTGAGTGDGAGDDKAGAGDKQDNDPKDDGLKGTPGGGNDPGEDGNSPSNNGNGSADDAPEKSTKGPLLPAPGGAGIRDDDKKANPSTDENKADGDDQNTDDDKKADNNKKADDTTPAKATDSN